MMREKIASVKAVSTILGVILTTISIYYFVKDRILSGSIFGILGILIIALSLMITWRQ